MTASLTFGGSDKVASSTAISAMLGVNGAGTILAWMKPTLASPPSNSAVYNLPAVVGDAYADGYYRISIGIVTAGSGEAGDKVWAHTYGAGSGIHKAGASYAKNEWNLVAMRWDGTNLSIWCRSESNGVTGHSIVPGEVPQSLTGHATACDHFTGGGDDVAFFNTVLTDANLNAIYAGTSVPTDFGSCTLYWPFDIINSPGAGQTPDTSGNTYTGTVTGASAGTQHVPAAAADPNVGTVSAITVDGLDVTFSASYTVGAYAGGGYYVVANAGTHLFTLSAVAANALQITDNYIGGVMLDPSDPTKQGFDNRTTGGRGPGNSYDAGSVQTLPLTVDVSDGRPRTIWLYRGLDAVQAGGAQSGCAAMVQLTVVKTDPGATALKPPGIGTTKPQYTTADINYSLYTQRAIPSGAVEPSWNTLLGYLKRPFVAFGTTVQSQCIAPTELQNAYANDQARSVGQLLLGMQSDSSLAHMLINRVVQAGLEVDAGIALGCTYAITNGGFGDGYKLLRMFAGRYLSQSSMLTTPATVSYQSQSVPYFSEDGYTFRGDATGPFPQGKPLFGSIANSAYPGSGSGVGVSYGANHEIRSSAQVEIGGTVTREPHWITFLSGTAQAGGASSITLAAGATGVGDGDRIYIVSGTGSGQTNHVATSGWNNTTKVAALVNAWSVQPDATSHYEVYQGGSYQELVSYAYATEAIAVVLAGETARVDASWIDYYKNRWVAEDGLLNPRYSPSPTQSTSNGRRFDDVDGTWTKKFYDTYASALWPDFAAPAAPSALTLGAATSTTQLLTWTDNSSNETSFEVGWYKTSDGVGAIAYITGIAANATSYTVNIPLSPGTDYTYVVRARNAAGASANSTSAHGLTASDASLPLRVERAARCERAIRV